MSSEKKALLLVTPIVLFLLIYAWLYLSHDLVRWYFWPRQGCSVAMWKGGNLRYYKSLNIEWSHGQTQNEKGEWIALWYWPTIRWTNVDFNKLQMNPEL